MIKKYISNFIIGYGLIQLLLFLFFFLFSVVLRIFKSIPEGWFGGFLEFSFVMFLVIFSFGLVLFFAYIYLMITEFMEFRQTRKKELGLNKKDK